MKDENKMITPKRPDVSVPGDDADRTMWKNGYIVSFDHKTVVWRFGFVDGSPQAKAFGLTSPVGVLTVKAHFNGKRFKG